MLLIILGLILIGLAIWVIYLMIIGGVGLGVALKQIFTGFRKVDNSNPKLVAARENLARQRAEGARIKAERLARRAARKDARNAR